MGTPLTFFEKVWNDHVIADRRASARRPAAAVLVEEPHDGIRDGGRARSRIEFFMVGAGHNQPPLADLLCE